MSTKKNCRTQCVLSAVFAFAARWIRPSFFSRLLREMSDRKPRVMCVCYPSIPGTTHRPDVRSLLLKALNQGLMVALACPYTPGTESIEDTLTPALTKYRRELYDHVVLLARTLTERLGPRERKQIAAFIPRSPMAHDPWPMPPRGISKVRQALIKRFADSDDEDDDLQLLAWIELTQDNKDQMVDIYPSDSNERERIQDLALLAGKTSQILDGCNFDTGWTPRTTSRFKHWKDGTFQMISASRIASKNH